MPRAVYVTEVGVGEVEVEILEDDGVHARVRVGGETFELALSRLPDGSLAIESGARRERWHHYVDTRGLVLADGTWQRRFTTGDPRDRWLRRGAASAKAGGGVVCAAMPGRVVRIAVAAGDIAEEGATLCVLEAMKMENDVRAPGSGRVTVISVREGESVEAGQALLTLDPASKP